MPSLQSSLPPRNWSTNRSLGPAFTLSSGGLTRTLISANLPPSTRTRSFSATYAFAKTHRAYTLAWALSLSGFVAPICWHGEVRGDQTRNARVTDELPLSPLEHHCQNPEYRRPSNSSGLMLALRTQGSLHEQGGRGPPLGRRSMPYSTPLTEDERRTQTGESSDDIYVRLALTCPMHLAPADDR